MNIKNRLYQHIRSLNKGNHHSIKLQRAWAKYGESPFLVFILETVSDKNILMKTEQTWIDKLGAYGPNGYNMVPKAGNNLGMIHSDMAKEKVAAKARGRVVSSETKAKMSVSSPKIRPKLSQEHKNKIAITLRGKTLSIETRMKIAKAGIGRIKSPETLAKMSASMKGKNLGKRRTDEQRAKISESMKGNHYALGYKHSAETRAKVSMAGIGRVFSAERNAKISEKLKGRKRTAEHTAKLVAARGIFKQSMETKEKISQTLKIWHAKKRAILDDMRFVECKSYVP